MAHTSSAKKRIHQYRNNQLRNSAARSLVKTNSRKMVVAVEAKDSDSVKKAYATLCSTLDKAAKKGSIKKETAIRRKARAARQMRLALQKA
jgi:small subunit ribosomal protein S20